MKLKKPSQSFNQSLLEPTKPSHSPSTTTDANQGRDDEEEVTINWNSDEAYMYYQSKAWQRKINDTLDYFTFSQPQHEQPVQPQQQISPIKINQSQLL